MIVVGTNHKYTSFEYREQFVFSENNFTKAYDFFMKNCGFKGCVIVNTCNRIEIYANVDDVADGFNKVKFFLIKFFELKQQAVEPAFYFLSGKKAFIHLCNVVCGMDSMLIGETQIAGQIKSSYLKSLSFYAIDFYTEKFFKKAFEINKYIRRSGFFSGYKTSIGNIALDFISKNIDQLKDKKILVIGVGKLSGLVLKSLRNKTNNMIFIANRTYEKASLLASQVGAKAVRFDELDNLLIDADIVISATSSPHYIINKRRIDNITEKWGGRFKKKIFFIDLAVPRDIEPEIRFVQGVELVNLSDLETVINLNAFKRKKQAEHAKRLILQKAVNLWENYIKSRQEEVISL